MTISENATYFSGARVLPILTPKSVKVATALSRILFEAGLTLQEIALRSPAALETIAALTQELLDLVVGAGSVLTPDLGHAAIRAGARFLVSPGSSAALLEFAVHCSVPFLPGVATVSEIMRLTELDCTAAKLFPAEPMGGISYLQALRGPLPSMKFCPSGGIDVTLARSYLQLPNVLGVGGSWITPDALVAGSQFAEIRRLAEEAARL
jgi:2-dehydro-3-deoxyphosphogluconate aldolase / (4S)-4-hydroxy-2-oxoglutarate aldolase